MFEVSCIFLLIVQNKWLINFHSFQWKVEWIFEGGYFSGFLEQPVYAGQPGSHYLLWYWQKIPCMVLLSLIIKAKGRRHWGDDHCIATLVNGELKQFNMWYLDFHVDKKFHTIGCGLLFDKIHINLYTNSKCNSHLFIISLGLDAKGKAREPVRLQWLDELKVLWTCASMRVKKHMCIL